MLQENCLMNQVLCLNKSWQPVTVRNVVKCLKKVFGGKAKIVDPYTYMMYDWEEWLDLPIDDLPFIQAIDLRIRLPSVIVMTDYNKMPKVSVTFNRRNIYLRDNYTCQYCDTLLDRPDVTIDHVIPRSRSEGKSTWENCVVACFPCNSKKRDRTPEEAKMKLLSVPKKPRWVPSFHNGEIPSEWEGFLNDVYWNTKLKK